jgi:probable F420-dependent oxidoreductase
VSAWISGDRVSEAETNPTAKPIWDDSDPDAGVAPSDYSRRMAHPRRFRFGVEMKEPFEGRTWADSAREVEGLGYSTLFVPDHVHSELGPIAAMAVAAAATTSLHVAPLVMACDFRHPVVAAKELASIDALSDGRLEVGLGAGYNPLDYSRSGIPMDAPGMRVRRLMEYVQVLRLLFGGGVVDFHGEFFHLDQIEGLPRPAHPAGPPILVAGGGPRLLTFAGTAADIVGVNPSTAAGRDNPATLRDALPSSIDDKIALLRETSGDRFDTLELNAWVSVASITEHARDLVAGLAAFAEAEVEDVLASPIVLAGTTAEIVERLLVRRQRWGYSYVALQQPHAHEFAGVVAELTGR